MINIESKKNEISINLPGGKSQFNRILILACYSNKKITVSNINLCTDVQELIDCLKIIGVKIENVNNTLVIHNSIKRNQLNGFEYNLNLGSGGTTIRFILPLLAYLGGKYTIQVSHDFKTRPIQELLELLELCGCQFQSKSYPIIFEGKILDNISVVVDCAKTSQYYSSFLMLANFAKITVNPINFSTSLGFVNQTKKNIQLFNNNITQYDIAVDATSFSYALAFGLTIKKVKIVNYKDINIFDEQADWELLKIFPIEKFDEINPQKITHFSCDISQCLDLFPTLVYLASCVDGTSEIFGIRNLEFKESDRVLECTKVLEFYGITYELTKDCIKIHGSNEIKEKFFQYTAPHDHRIIMMSFLFMKRHFGGSIINENFVSKSFPDFFVNFNQ